MNRQHAAPVHISADRSSAAPLPALPLGSGVDAYSESFIRDLIHAQPASLPIGDIDPLFSNPVPLCTELRTQAGPIDNFMITSGGLPVLVECKLWRNPEARRLVVGQILDYAKELGRWTCSDIQREVSRRLGGDSSTMISLVRGAGHAVDEIEFNDAVSLNLRRGRFLLLIVGDGIREGVEAIAEYLQAHAGLHFTLGLVEMPIFRMADGSFLVAPRVLARTETILRTVVEVPIGLTLAGTLDEEEDDEATPLSSKERESRAEARARRRESRFAFRTAFLADLKLNDPEQEIPRPSKAGHISFRFPASGNSCWLSVYRSGGSGRVGLFLSGTSNSPGETAARRLAEDMDGLRTELGPTARIAFGPEFPDISDSIALVDFDDPVARETAFVWLRARTNDFINVLRPRIKAAISEIENG